MVFTADDIANDKIKGSQHAADPVEIISEKKLDSGQNNSTQFFRSGQKIHNLKVELLDEEITDEQRPLSRQRPLAHGFTGLLQKIKSIFTPRPKRDAFIASFFDFEDENKR